MIGRVVRHERLLKIIIEGDVGGHIKRLKSRILELNHIGYE